MSLLLLSSDLVAVVSLDKPFKNKDEAIFALVDIANNVFLGRNINVFKKDKNQNNSDLRLWQQFINNFSAFITKQNTDAINESYGRLLEVNTAIINTIKIINEMYLQAPSPDINKVRQFLSNLKNQKFKNLELVNKNAALAKISSSFTTPFNKSKKDAVIALKKLSEMFDIIIKKIEADIDQIAKFMPTYPTTQPASTKPISAHYINPPETPGVSGQTYLKKYKQDMEELFQLPARDRTGDWMDQVEDIIGRIEKYDSNLAQKYQQQYEALKLK